MKELTKRIFVAVWGIPLLLILSYLGGYYFLGLILIINGMMLIEFFSIYQSKEIYSYKWLALFMGTLLLIFTFYGLISELNLIILASVTIISLSLLFKQKGISAYNMAFTLAGLLYISGFLAALLYLRIHFEALTANSMQVSYAGGRLLIVLWVSIWVCDTAAYFGGRAFGKHKLAPVISPNKTIEGGIFGLIFGIFSFVLLGGLLLPGLQPEYLWISGAVVGVLGQLGDLVESRFKRDAGVKDTSTILPGHGGFLDRFDSLIFVSPFLLGVYYYLKF